MTEVHLPELLGPVVIRERMWGPPRLERPDGSPLLVSRDGRGYPQAETIDGRYVTVELVWVWSRAAWGVRVSGRLFHLAPPMPRWVWGPVAVVAVLAGLVGGGVMFAFVGASYALAAADLLRRDGSRARRRLQAAAVVVVALLFCWLLRIGGDAFLPGLA